MRMRFNGEPREVPEGGALLALLEALGIDPRRSAVAVNGTVVPRGEVASYRLAEGDRVEVIEAVGGG